MLFRRRETPDRAEMRAQVVQLTAERDRLWAQVVQLTAENDRLQGEARLEAGARAQLVEAVRLLSTELCERSFEYRDTRRALDSLMADAFDGPHNPI
jgi:hypothetical protein